MMKYIALFILLLGFSACVGSSPFARVSQPDEIISYANGQLIASIRNRLDLDSIIEMLFSDKSRWERYYITTPSTQILARIYSNGASVGTMLVGNNFVIIETSQGVFSTRLSKSEFESLTFILNSKFGSEKLEFTKTLK